MLKTIQGALPPIQPATEVQAVQFDLLEASVHKRLRHPLAGAAVAEVPRAADEFRRIRHGIASRRKSRQFIQPNCIE
ncbi:hypothetical protein ACFQU7_27165 [Pseudoroseomonas wenyumeiae]